MMRHILPDLLKDSPPRFFGNQKNTNVLLRTCVSHKNEYRIYREDRSTGVSFYNWRDYIFCSKVERAQESGEWPRHSGQKLGGRRFDERK